ncbi:hypothetical protein CEXT_312441 [Caerostris extrusa]|uniref:Uncharacterized protein n=1 Tax=Caerostris extrusa TaxID=172846 RepID=A0AAV4VLK9_CAEEX|nr:hypothetical protein CEXT_312441 [Caerostris extrusa]
MLQIDSFFESLPSSSFLDTLFPQPTRYRFPQPTSSTCYRHFFLLSIIQYPNDRPNGCPPPQENFEMKDCLLSAKSIQEFIEINDPKNDCLNTDIVLSSDWTLSVPLELTARPIVLVLNLKDQ